jgi:hypothetical protein
VFDLSFTNIFIIAHNYSTHHKHRLPNDEQLEFRGSSVAVLRLPLISLDACWRAMLDIVTVKGTEQNSEAPLATSTTSVYDSEAEATLRDP